MWLFLSAGDGANEVIMDESSCVFHNLSTISLRTGERCGRRERMKVKWMANGWVAAGLWLAGAMGAAGADVDFTDAVLLRNAGMASVRAETLDRWASPDGQLFFKFFGEGRDRAVWLGGNRDRHDLDVRALGLPVYEAQAVFRPDGGLASLELVLFSRGDVVQAGGTGDAAVEAAVHDEKAFRALCARVNGQLEEALGKAAQHRTQRPVKNHEQRLFRWTAPQGAVVLSVGLTEERGTFRGEYIRVKVLPAAPSGGGPAVGGGRDRCRRRVGIQPASRRGRGVWRTTWFGKRAGRCTWGTSRWWTRGTRDTAWWPHWSG